MSRSYAFSYHVTHDMMKRAIIIINKRQSSDRKRLPIYSAFAAIGLLIGVLGSYLGLFSTLSTDLLLGLLVGFYVGVLLWLVVYRFDVRRHVKRTEKLLHTQGEVFMKLSAKGVEVGSGLGQGLSYWAAFDDLFVAKDLILLKMGAWFHVIPRDGLPADVDFKTFQADVESWHRGAS